MVNDDRIRVHDETQKKLEIVKDLISEAEDDLGGKLKEYRTLGDGVNSSRVVAEALNHFVENKGIIDENEYEKRLKKK